MAFEHTYYGQDPLSEEALDEMYAEHYAESSPLSPSQSTEDTYPSDGEVNDMITGPADDANFQPSTASDITQSPSGAHEDEVVEMETDANFQDTTASDITERPSGAHEDELVEMETELSSDHHSDPTKQGWGSPIDDDFDVSSEMADMLDEAMARIGGEPGGWASDSEMGDMLDEVMTKIGGEPGGWASDMRHERESTVGSDGSGTLADDPDAEQEHCTDQAAVDPLDAFMDFISVTPVAGLVKGAAAVPSDHDGLKLPCHLGDRVYQIPTFLLGDGSQWSLEREFLPDVQKALYAVPVEQRQRAVKLMLFWAYHRALPSRSSAMHQGHWAGSLAFAWLFSSDTTTLSGFPDAVMLELLRLSCKAYINADAISTYVSLTNARAVEAPSVAPFRPMYKLLAQETAFWIHHVQVGDEELMKLSERLDVEDFAAAYSQAVRGYRKNGLAHFEPFTSEERPLNTRWKKFMIRGEKQTQGLDGE